jgi:hypothetical protein
MRERILRRGLCGIALVSMFGAACNSQTTTTQTEPPPSCTAPSSDGGLRPGDWSSGLGTVTGTELVARLCEGGAIVSLGRTTPPPSPPSQLLMDIIESPIDPTRDSQIALPVGATRLLIVASLGVADAPGTFTESSGCGGIVLCAIFPPPATVTCRLDIDVCSPGCIFSGSTCVPLEPATCYEANSATSCGGGAQHADGSWRLTLSSVDRSTSPDSGTSDQDVFVAHGRLDATLVKIVNATNGVDANAPPAITTSLSLTF